MQGPHIPHIPNTEEILQLRRICSQLAATAGNHPDHNDLSSLRNIVANATVVGLGEQTHGTREFFHMKHRVMNFLITQMDFTVVVIKANMSTCEAVNQYIHHGTGNLKAMLKKFYCGKSEEVFELIEWMRAHNKTTAKKIYFAGFDFQDPTLNRDIIEKTLMAVGDTHVSELIETIFLSYNSIKKIVERQILSDDELTTISNSNKYQKLLSNIQLLDAHVTKLKDKLGPENYAWIKQNVRLLYQAAEYLLNFDTRHRAMHENINWLQTRYPNAKIILWAHNFHLQKQDQHISLGQLLAESLGNDYCTIGLTTYAGTYSAYSAKGKNARRDITIPKPTPESLEACLQRLNMPIVLVNFNEDDNVPKFLKQPIPVHVLTNFAETHSFRPQNVSMAYNAIIFIENTSASRQLKTKIANDEELPTGASRKNNI
jgi:erythromycin esterase